MCRRYFDTPPPWRKYRFFRRARSCAILTPAVVLAGGFILLASGNTAIAALPAGSGVVSGIVVSEDGLPLAGVNVRPQGASTATVTDGSGAFAVGGLPWGSNVTISAWKEGYYCGIARDCPVPAEGVSVRLIRVQSRDNPLYSWVPPTSREVKGSCAECHNPAIIEMSLNDAHLKSARNPRFLTMYYGTDTQGNRSAATTWGKGTGPWKNTLMPLPPDPSQPYFGPGYVQDFPGLPIDCTACHIPGATLSGRPDPAGVTGTDTFGIHCDFCHKTADILIDPVTRMPFQVLAGVRSMKITRPFTDDPERPQLFFGTLEDDNVPEEDTALPLYSESRFCAPCHTGGFWNTGIYNSYGEWVNSPYADVTSGKFKSCQDCHMPSPTEWKGQRLVNVAPGKGGIDRDPSRIHSHLTSIDEGLLRNSLTMTAGAEMSNGRLIVNVTITNDRTGHHIPTDCPLRHMILVIDTRDPEGNRLKQDSGNVVPDWCGKGDPEQGRYAGLPGNVFAKVLKEKWTEHYPAQAYWRHTDVYQDNRIAACKSDKSSYAFLVSGPGKYSIAVTLIYRRAFIELMEIKKWDAPDVVMALEHLTLTIP